VFSPTPNPQNLVLAVVIWSGSAYGAAPAHIGLIVETPAPFAPEHRPRSSCCQFEAIQQSGAPPIPAGKRVAPAGGPLTATTSLFKHAQEALHRVGFGQRPLRPGRQTAWAPMGGNCWPWGHCGGFATARQRSPCSNVGLQRRWRGLVAGRLVTQWGFSVRWSSGAWPHDRCSAEARRPAPSSTTTGQHAVRAPAWLGALEPLAKLNLGPGPAARQISPQQTMPNCLLWGVHWFGQNRGVSPRLAAACPGRGRSALLLTPGDRPDPQLIDRLPLPASADRVLGYHSVSAMLSENQGS